MFSRLVVSQVKHNSYFLAGLAIGLWISLAVIPLDEEPAACTNVATEPYSDDYEPVREERPMEGRGAASAGSLQRPRYYSTELGMRGSLLAAALAGSGDSDARAAALNATASRLQPALKFFITARGPRPSPGAPNVIAFTDTREMLKPFHTLKYLADNYLEEFDFFFLVSDTSYVNSRRLTELVSKLSVSQDVYMGTVAEDDSHYCSLHGGILLSNSVLRSIHSSLDWCVRNSYSAHHHENLGRCILHAAHLSCMQELQGQQYDSAYLSEGGALQPELANAVTVYPLAEPRDFHHVHAYVSRVYLERARVDYIQLGAELGAAGDKLWPRGLRVEPPLAPPNITRFDHLRWTWFNSTHEMMPDDHHSTAPLSTVHRKALDLILDEVTAWLAHRYDTTDVELLEGARVWEPASALRYKLWLKVGPNKALKGVEAVRVLGAARLAPARYVTESSPLTVVLPTSRAAASAVALRRLAALVLPRRANVRLIVVLFRSEGDEEATATLKSTITELNQKYPDGQLDLTELPPNDPLTLLSRVQSGLAGKTGVGDRIRGLETRAAAVASRKMYGSDALLLFISDDADFNEDFLNRVRMNTLSGEQWFLPAGFARYAQYNHPLFVDANGRKPQVHTGRFNAQHTHVLAAYARDVDNALAEWASSNGSTTADLASILAASHLRCILAPEPALQLAPRPAPCGQQIPREPCLKAYRDNGFRDLDLGAKHELAKLLLQVQANV